MDDVGYTLPWQEGRMTVIQPAVVLQLLRSAWWDRLRAVDVCPRTAASRGTKLCTYMRWFARPEHSLGCTVLDMSVRPQQLRAFMRFRLGCHDLPIEAGRHAGIARQHRTCTRCTLGVVGDEKHLLLECPAAQRIRDEYAHLFTDPVQTMKEFMWQKDSLGVLKFVLDALAFMRAADDSDGDSDDPLSY